MNRIIYFLLAASFITATVSCTKEEDVAKPEKSGRVIVLTAHTDRGIDTRTSLDGVAVKWSERDWISAFAPSRWGEYHMERSTSPKVSADGTVAHFSLYGFEEEEEIEYAVYAPLSTITISDAGINLEIPTSQQGRNGSFGEYANVAVARVTDIDNLYFKNVGGLLAVKLKGAGSHQVASITIAGEEANGGGMTGKTVVQIDENEVVTTACTGRSHVTIADIANVEVGSTFYAVVAPGTYSNVTITFTDTQGAKATYTKKTDMVVERNGNLLIGGFDIPEEKWVQTNPDDPIEFEDPLVKAALVAGHDNLTIDTNGDGEISYAEAAAVPSLNQLFYAGQFPDNAKITSFDEFQYFTGIESIVGDFAGCRDLTSIVLPPNVTSIVEGFGLCSSLTSVILPESLTEIGLYAFFGCENLASITLPESLTTIGEYGLAACAITSISIPQSVTSLGENAFSSCAYLASVDLPDHLSTIPAGAFSSCFYLESVDFPEALRTIGDYAFSNCSSLTSITIPEGVIHIGERAFDDCRSLETVTLPSQLEVIERSTFSGCRSLLSIEIPETVTSIGEGAFYGCGSLTSITLPSNVTVIEASTFSGCSSLTSINLENITSIGEGAFSGCSSMTSFTLPPSVTVIEASTFSGCSSLTSINLDNITRIGEEAFSGSGLVSVDLPVGLEAIEASTFESCYYLTTVNNMDAVTRIGEKAFKRCNSLKTFTIPPYVETIEAGTFSECRSLSSVTIPDGVTSIGEDAFYNCRVLSEISFPEGLVEIGDRAFYQANLRAIVLPPALGTIGAYAFQSCGLRSVTAAEIDPEEAWGYGLSIGEGAFTWNANLQELILPITTTSIGARAFSDVSNLLTSIRIPERVEEIGEEAFSGCSHLKEVELPESLGQLGAKAFYNCGMLETINIPEGLWTIEDETFRNCSSLTEIVLFAESLGTSAFQGCSNLSSVTLMSYWPVGLPETPESVFADTHADLRIFVPADALPEYQEYEEWSVYADRLYAIE